MASLIQRGDVFYIQYCVGGKARRTSTGTNVLQLAKDKLRQFESSQLRGFDSPLPTRTPIAQVVGAYARHIRSYKTPKSAQTDIYYLREVFGPICPELEINSRKPIFAKRCTVARNFFSSGVINLLFRAKRKKSFITGSSSVSRRKSSHEKEAADKTRYPLILQRHIAIRSTGFFWNIRYEVMEILRGPWPGTLGIWILRTPLS